MSSQTLLVIGAGPKAIALAAKHSALRALGCDVPRLTIIDRYGLAANWGGAHGFTDGRHGLGTLPDKDIGFPYASTAWGDAATNTAVDHAMTAYSWQRFLIDTHQYANWIDRGRPRPQHSDWTAYLQWVGGQIALDVQIADVTQLGRDDAGRWRLTGQTPDGTVEIAGDGLVLTGPGTPVTVVGQPRSHPRVYDGQTFWQNIARFGAAAADHHKPLRVGVVGTGETAAAVVVTLTETLNDRAMIDVISSRGVLYTRDEGFEENRIYSDPDGYWVGRLENRICTFASGNGSQDLMPDFRWASLTEADRREFVRRTDRGVFSIQAVADLTRANNVRSIAGAVKQMTATDDFVLLDVAYNGRTTCVEYDFVVVAIGFNPLWFTALFDAPTHALFDTATGDGDATTIERGITADLSLDNFAPRLHLPMLAGVAQGPGFPNLSSLGLLSDRVLASYVRRA